MPFREKEGIGGHIRSWIAAVLKVPELGLVLGFLLCLCRRR